MINKRVVVFVSTLSFSQNTTAGYNRIINYAKALAIHSTTVILFSFYGNFNDIKDLEKISDNIYRIKEKIKAKGSYLKFIFSLNRIKKYLKNYNTCFILYPTSKFGADIIFLIIFKIFSSNKIFLEINELRRAYPKNRYPERTLYFKFLRIIKNLIDIFFYKILEYSSSFYNGILVISTNLYSYYSKYNKKILLIPILIDFTEKKNNNLSSVKDSFNIGFFGTVSFRKEGIENILLVIKNLNRKDINTKLFLYGPISNVEYEYFQEWLKKEDMTNKIFYNGILKHDVVLDEMQKMDLLILPRPHNQQTKYGFSTKLAEYLISGVPVLVTDVSDNSKYIQDGINGYIVHDITPAGFEKKIIEILKNYEKTKYKITQEAYNTAKKYFDYRLYAETLNKFLFD
ncbi:glycosyltransferase [Rosettibacter firmus]|uniref:glycosyltransferase n=1 Tax=Rosettibacter firmus TaxID=3111522 RepID=UPI00336BCB73